MNIWLKKIGLLAVTVFLSVLGLEGVFRVVLLVPTGNPAADRSPVFYAQAKERMHPWSHGASHALRIAVIGDSFTTGHGVQEDDIYAARIERLLNLNAGVPPAEVQVFAHEGISTYQQIDFLHLALANNPDIVILGICLNDFEDWSHLKRIRVWREEWMTPTPSRFLAFWMRHSRMVSFVASRLWASGSSERCVNYYRHLYDPEGAGTLRFTAAIREFRDECAARQVAFVPVIFPLLSFDFSPNRYPMQFAHDRIHEICHDLGIPSLDLLSAFQGDSPERMQAIPGIDPHPSEIAHRIAAEKILKYLLKNHLIDGAYKPKDRSDTLSLHAIWQKTIDRLQSPPGLSDPP